MPFGETMEDWMSSGKFCTRSRMNARGYGSRFTPAPARNTIESVALNAMPADGENVLWLMW